MSRAPIIAILPYDLRKSRDFAAIPLTDIAAFGPVENLKTLGDLEPQDQLLVNCCGRTLFGRYPGLRCKISLLLAEPRGVQARYYRIIPFLYRRFHAILTHDTDLIRKLPNAVAHNAAFATVLPVEAPEKAAMTSLIASKRNDLTGHKLRHEIAAWAQAHNISLNLYGRAYKSVADKAEALAPYHFSVVIENSRENGYFTEKLVDCLLTKTVPIYWGAPDILRNFNLDGMIICTSAAEIQAAITTVSSQKYQQMLPAIVENFTRAQKFCDPDKYTAETLRTHN
ncbi:MAG: glycosyltransferase family 10 [Paracoccaceae bacterium]